MQNFNYFFSLVFLFLLFFISNANFSPIAKSEVILNTKNENSKNDTFYECIMLNDYPYSDSSKIKNKCDFVSKYCSVYYIDYMYFYYCYAKGYELISWLLFLSVFAFDLYLLASTASKFFVPLLKTIAHSLNLSDEIVGLTFLPLGNAAPDIFTAISGIVDANDFPMILGQILGTAFFLSTIVLGTVIVSVKSFHISRICLIRDILMLFVIIFCIYFVAWNGVIYWYESIPFIIVYLVYIGINVYFTGKRRNASRNESIQSQMNTPFILSPKLTKYLSIDSPKSGEKVVQEHSDHPGHSIISDYFTYNDDDTLSEDGCPLPIDAIEAEIEPFVFSLEDIVLLPRVIYPNSSKISFSVRLVKRILFIIELPFLLLRTITIPVVNDENWNFQQRILLCLSPVFTITFIIFDLGDPIFFSTINFPLYLIIMSIIGIVLFFILYYFTDNENVPRKVIYPIFIGLGLVSTICWSDLLADQCVQMLESFGLMLDVSTSLLGATVLAIGITVGEWITDTTVAMEGMPKMAVASVFGSPLMGIMFGVGLAIFVANITSGVVDSPLNPQISLGFVCLAFSLICTLMVFYYYKFRTKKYYAYFLFFIFSIYMILSVLIETNIIWSH